MDSNTGELPPLFLLFTWQKFPSARIIWSLLDGTDSQDFVCECLERLWLLPGKWDAALAFWGVCCCFLRGCSGLWQRLWSACALCSRCNVVFNICKLFKAGNGAASSSPCEGCVVGVSSGQLWWGHATALAAAKTGSEAAPGSKTQLGAALGTLQPGRSWQVGQGIQNWRLSGAELHRFALECS